MRSFNFDKIVKTDQECINLGYELSKYLEEKDIILLYGELASGKTTFVKGILKGFNYKKVVTSPTFTLVNEYNSKYKVIHIDFYREENINRWINLGIYDYYDSKNIIIIEWPNLIPELIPKNAINIYFEHVEYDKRRIILK